jgi:selenocysteine lyase/cysteine desulfurase
VVVDRVAPGDLATAIASGPPPRVVATSWVQYGRGGRADLPALGAACRDAGALLCVDAIQGLGLLPADFEAWGVGVATADGHKWLLGPEGAGVLYVRAEHLPRLRVLEPGWNSAADRSAYDDRALVLDPTARRLEGGTLNIAGILGLGAAIDLLTTAGVDRIWTHVDALCGRLVDALAGTAAVVLSDRTPGARSGIVNISVPGHDPVAVRDALLANGIVASPRAGGVRLSPHGYTTTEEIDRAAAALGALD